MKPFAYMYQTSNGSQWQWHWPPVLPGMRPNLRSIEWAWSEKYDPDGHFGFRGAGIGMPRGIENIHSNFRWYWQKEHQIEDEGTLHSSGATPIKCQYVPNQNNPGRYDRIEFPQYIPIKWGVLLTGLFVGVRYRYYWMESSWTSFAYGVRYHDKRTGKTTESWREGGIPYKQSVGKLFFEEFRAEKPWHYLFCDGPSNPFEAWKEAEGDFYRCYSPYAGTCSKTLNPLSSGDFPGIEEFLPEDIHDEWSDTEHYLLGANSLAASLGGVEGGLNYNPSIDYPDNVGLQLEVASCLHEFGPQKKISFNTPNEKLFT